LAKAPRSFPLGWVALVAGLLAGGGSFVYRGWIRPAISRTQVESFYLLDGRVLAKDASGFRNTDGHLSLVDTRTGQLVVKVRADFAQYAGASASGLWFRDIGQYGLHRRNAATLAVEVKQMDWAASLGGIKEVSDLVGGERAFSILTNDGRLLLLDADTLATRQAADRMFGGIAEPGHRGRHDRATTSSFRGALGGVSVSRGSLPMDQAAIVCGKQSPGQALLHPALLTDGRSKGLHDSGIVVGDTFFVVHRRVLGTDDNLQLSRIGCAGAPLWTMPLDSNQVVGALLDGDQLLIVTRGADHYDQLRAFAVADGKLRWSHDY
jgi:hypothetical protein